MVAKAKKWVFLLAFVAIAVLADSAFAQFANTRIQLPTLRVTQFNSSFSVPDGGTINLGGFGSSRTFPNGRSTSSSSPQVTAHILIMKELEQAMLANARPAILRSNFDQQQLNGNAQTQTQADFISENINRR